MSEVLKGNVYKSKGAYNGKFFPDRASFEKWNHKVGKRTEEIPVIAQSAFDKLQAKCERYERALEKYRVAMDKLYNHNAAVRQAVVEHFGIHHPKQALADSEEG